MGGLGYAGYSNYVVNQSYQNLKQENTALETELTKTRNDFASTTEKLNADIESFRDLLIATQSERVNAEQDAQKRQEIIDSMNSQINSMSETLGLYQKFITTDRELLAKYSKVYFLNENYTPKQSIIIPTSYTLEPEKEKYISADVWPFLQKMLDDSKTANVDLEIISAFRSYDTQSTLKTAYTVVYGSGSNTFSADQGYSEHQLGTTIDFTTSKLGLKYSTFEKTPEYTWLTENAYKYGFILSYPKSNAYYIFEPWHWRFVGKALALRLHNENRNFVDMPQRDINEYLISIFDK